MSLVPDFLQKLQSGKKELLQNERPSEAQRSERLLAWTDALRESIPDLYRLDPAACFFSRDYYETAWAVQAIATIERTVKAMTAPSEASPRRASGLHAVVLSVHTPLPSLFETLSASLAAGNSILVRAWPAQAALLEKLQSLLVGTGFSPGSLQFVADGENETLSLFLGHPGVRLVSVLGTDDASEKALAQVPWMEKKWQIFRSGKTSAIVLADADLDMAADGIIRAALEGQGTLSWNVSRVIVVDSIEAEFKAVLKNKLASISSQLTDSSQKKKNAILQSLTSEQARELHEGSPLTVLENVSNCSEYHQLELQSPLLFLIPIKYAFDAAKWVNNLPNALCLQMWGSDEKIDKLLPKLETSQVFRRTWVGALEVWNQGIKSGFAGTPDPRWDGGFYSDRTNF